jgi:hippurate hydrolase
MTSLERLLADSMPRLVSVRHDLHAHPQLAYQETYASGVVQKQLTEWQIPFTAGVAETGVVAWIDPSDARRNEPAIGLRADLDALPIAEESGLPYTSTHPGRMHACGHDGHTAILLGAARVLSQVRNQLPRPVKLLFQPAEEVGAGAQRMIDAGALSDKVGGRRVSAMFGLHGSPLLPHGWYATKPGALLAGCSDFEITIHGTGGHAALPHLTADPIVSAAQLVTALQTLVSRNIDPVHPAVVSVCGIHGGDATNVIPDSVRLVGTIRAHFAETFDLMQKRLREMAEHVARGFGCRADVTFTLPFPPVDNDADLAEFAFTVAEQVCGVGQVNHMDHAWMASEDFSYYGRAVPSCFGFIGVIPPGRDSHPMLHTPHFDFSDTAIETGVRLMCGYALNAEKLSVI